MNKQTLTQDQIEKAQLTDEQIEKLAQEHEDSGFGVAGDTQQISVHHFHEPDSLRNFVRAVEDAIRGQIYSIANQAAQDAAETYLRPSITKTKQVMNLVEQYRCSGGREEHWARKDILENEIHTLVRKAEAFDVWIDKTDWVQETVQGVELGKHRADILRERIEKANRLLAAQGLPCSPTGTSGEPS